MADPQIRAILRGLERLTERVVTKITLDVAANLIETTRVDTGWARANWVPSVGSPEEPSSEDVEGFRPSAQDAASKAGEQAAATASVAASYRLPMGSTFVTNNVPYVPRLNDEVDVGFVQRAVAKAVTGDIRGLRG